MAIFKGKSILNNGITTDVRPFRPADEADVVGVWHRSGLAAYTCLPTWQSLTIEAAHHVFHNVIQPQCNIRVGTVADRVVAYLALICKFRHSLGKSG